MSYQLITFAILPTTLVSGASTMEDSGLPLKSLDTSSFESTPRMPFSSPSAAALNAALIVSFVIGFSARKVRSTTETFGVRND